MQHFKERLDLFFSLAKTFTTTTPKFLYLQGFFSYDSTDYTGYSQKFSPCWEDLIDISRGAENQTIAPANTDELQKQIQQMHGLPHSITKATNGIGRKINLRHDVK